MPPLRLDGDVLTRFKLSRFVTPNKKPEVPNSPPKEPLAAVCVRQAASDFEAELREETRQRAARLCHYGAKSAFDPLKGNR
jgi:hypothetical protein